MKSLADFAAGLDTDLLLCPVRALRLYLLRARSLSPGRHRLFVSPRRPARPLSKKAVSFFLREVISAAGAARPQVGSLMDFCFSLVDFLIFYIVFLFSSVCSLYFDSSMSPFTHRLCQNLKVQISH